MTKSTQPNRVSRAVKVPATDVKTGYAISAQQAEETPLEPGQDSINGQLSALERALDGLEMESNLLDRELIQVVLPSAEDAPGKEALEPLRCNVAQRVKETVSRVNSLAYSIQKLRQSLQIS